MFKKGDKVVCIVNNHILEENIFCGHIYTIRYCNDDSSMISLCESLWYYPGEYFLSLKEYRRQKLKNIESCSKVEIEL